MAERTLAGQAAWDVVDRLDRIRPIGPDVVKAEADHVLKEYTEAGWEITQPVQWAYDSLLQRSEW
jgi:hypothetical protein